MKTFVPISTKYIFVKFSLQHGLNFLSMVNGMEILLVALIQLMLKIMKRIKTPDLKTIPTIDGSTIHNIEFQ